MLAARPPSDTGSAKQKQGPRIFLQEKRGALCLETALSSKVSNLNFLGGAFFCFAPMANTTSTTNNNTFQEMLEQGACF